MGNFKPIVHRYEATFADFFINSFLVETENGVVGIDAPIAISSSRELRSKLDKIGKPLLAVLITHGHPDHFTSLGEFTKGFEVPILATQETLDFALREDKEKSKTAVLIFGDEYPKNRIFPNKIVRGGDEFTFDGVKFALRDFGPGESDDDCAWVLDIDGIKHVFLGDIIHNHMHCFFRDGHPLQWLNNLDRLLLDFDHTAILYTGHGDPCGTEMVYWHRGYIQAFLGTLKSMLRNRDSLTEEEQKTLVAKMQSFLPNDKTLLLLNYELPETIKLLREKNIV